MRARTQAPDPDPRRWLAWVVLLVATFMDLLDSTIVFVALPAMAADLDAGFAAMEWVVAAYTMTFAVGLITGGRLGDIYGRKRVFMMGMTGFSLASLLAGLAPSAEVLIAARGLQGLMAAVMVPQVLALAQVIFAPAERVTAFALYGVTLGLASVVGPLLGGFLTELDLLGLSWRPIFLINVPVGIAGMAAAAVLITESRSPHPLRLDWLGVLLGGTTVLLIVFPLVEGRPLGWPAWIFAAMALSVPAFVAFAYWQRHKSRADGSALVEPRLFAHRGFVAGLLVSLALVSSLASFWFIIVLWLQVGLGYGALETALVAVGSPVASMAIAMVAIRMAPRLGRYQLTLGFGVAALSVAVLIDLLSVLGDDVTGWHATPSLVLLGLALGLVNPVLLDFVLAAVDEQDAGTASGVAHTVQQVGGAVGVAVVGAIFFAALGASGPSAGRAAAGDVELAFSSAGAPPNVSARLADQFAVCFADRAAAADPNVLPESCRAWEESYGALPASQLASAVPKVDAAASEALEMGFTGALRGSLWYHLGAFVIAGLLALLLPRHARTEATGAIDENAAALPTGSGVVA